MINNDLIEQKITILIESLKSVVDEIEQNKDLPQDKLMDIWYKHKERMNIERNGLLGLLFEELNLNNEKKQGEADVVGTVFFEKTNNAIDEFYKNKVKPLIYS
ncbi:hypothetical protein [Flavobacterium sp. H4147]|uniref:hypothetical protein n=1 Tax=Flavobacterium sp. H4147 TaxID=3034149 RepID=UPI0023EC1045|nr:hypothetical protein [Flavobacterium sp. H4147]